MSYYPDDKNEKKKIVMNIQRNYYGRLCTEMYEILHEKAPQDELNFYMSYARKGQHILEALCGSGRFLVPFLKKGFDIKGVDNSPEMLEKLRLKAPCADILLADIEQYHPDERFDYVFVSSGSISLFTDIQQCKRILKTIYDLLQGGGKFVFAVDTIANRCEDDTDYKTSVSVKTAENYDLLLKTKNQYDEHTHTLFSPGIYELYNCGQLLQREFMDFQTHLYEYGEMEEYLNEIGFTEVKTYSSFKKEIAINDLCEMFLFECNF